MENWHLYRKLARRRKPLSFENPNKQTVSILKLAEIAGQADVRKDSQPDIQQPMLGK